MLVVVSSRQEERFVRGKADTPTIVNVRDELRRFEDQRFVDQLVPNVQKAHQAIAKRWSVGGVVDPHMSVGIVVGIHGNAVDAALTEVAGCQPGHLDKLVSTQHPDVPQFAAQPQLTVGPPGHGHWSRKAVDKELLHETWWEIRG